MTGTLTIVIGSYLEPDLVGRIRAAQPAARVVYEPDLLPVPRYQADHSGPPRDLRAADLDRWRSLTGQADIFFDFDWLEPAGMAARSPRLRWIQATSAGIGGFMQRTGLRQCPGHRHHGRRHPRGAPGGVRPDGRAALHQGRA